MQNKKLGVIFLIVSVIISLIIINFIFSLNKESRELGCFSNENCGKIESSLNITHLAFGVIGFIFALGFYLVFFSRSEEFIMKRLDDDKKRRSDEERFEILLKGLDEYEKRVVNAVKEQDGITQSTLMLRVGMSKAKLSYVLQGLERKGLIVRVKKGKTL